MSFAFVGLLILTCRHVGNTAAWQQLPAAEVVREVETIAW